MTSIIITSVISPTSTPLDYSPIRSVFDPSQRIMQTVDTIKSIRSLLGDATRILLVDCSHGELPDLSPIKNLLSASDQFHDIREVLSVADIVSSPNKGAGELYMLDWMIENGNFESDIYKISGRYYLDPTFDFNILDKTADINCKARGFSHANNVCLTTFYRMASKDIFRRYIAHGKLLFDKYPFISAEHVLYNFLASHQGELKIQNLDRIGVCGRIAVHGEVNCN